MENTLLNLMEEILHFDPGVVLKNGNPRKKPSFHLGATPDWRAWGGGSFTTQNQRLVYWPLLKTGDFDGMTPQFDFYNRALPAATARVKEYWGHDGSCFTEQMENFGLPIAVVGDGQNPMQPKEEGIRIPLMELW